MRSGVIPGACFATVLFLSSQAATAIDRFVVVNGQLLDAYWLAQLDEAAGERVPDGRYWLNLETGAWGYEGGSLQGYIGRPTYDTVKDNFCVQNPGICP
jgi:hypothetical protein